MYLLNTTTQFDNWLKKLKDSSGKARILAALKMMENGHLGDWKVVGGKVSELRIHYGPGYRVYFSRQGERIIVLLSGSDKSRQAREIKNAKDILKGLEEGHD